MNTRNFGSALAFALLATGCAAPHSETPLATNFPTSKQPKVQAAGHWAAIAQDVARQISRDLGDSGPLHVQESRAPSEFERAFSRQLVSALMAEGRSVSRSPDAAKVLAFETQTVRFSPDRFQNRQVGGLTLIAGGLWALAAVDASAAGVATAGAVAYDGHQALTSEFARGDTPATEILITVHVSEGDRYIAHRSLVYYAADTDRRLYEGGNGVQAVHLKGGQ